MNSPVSTDDSCESDRSTASAYSPEHHQRREFEMNGQMELDEFKDFYTRRKRTLEVYRNNFQTTTQSPEETDTAIMFTRLQSDMATLLESDVGLLQQLISLGESIEKLKSIAATAYHEQEGLSAASSENSLKDMNEHCTMNGSGMVPHAAYTSEDSDAERNDHVDDEDQIDIALYSTPCKQYFSRQNSVLRIPIPPGRRRSTAFRHRNCMKRASNGNASTTSSDGDGGGSCVSSSSFPDRSSRMYSFDRVNETFRTASAGTIITDTTLHHASQESCDSGVHNLSNSGWLDTEDTVFV